VPWFVGGINGESSRRSWQPSVGSNWTGFASLGGSQSASPAVTFSSGGLGQAFTRGTGGDLQTFWQQSAGSTWTGPLSLGGTLGR